MPLPTRLDHCVIHVSDWKRSNAFYRDVMGARTSQPSDGNHVVVTTSWGAWAASPRLASASAVELVDSSTTL
jgi:catechol 2,3-dioxygenase-like lactoylglutathione lyase family enzyme